VHQKPRPPPRRPDHREGHPQHRDGGHERTEVLLWVRPQHGVADDDGRSAAPPHRSCVIESQRIRRSDSLRTASRILHALVLIAPAKANQCRRARQRRSCPLHGAVVARGCQRHRHQRRELAWTRTPGHEHTGANVGKSAARGQ
jgi:hypothetical protein